MDTLTGQRLIEAADLPLNLAITSISHDHIVRFSDGFETHLSANWIDNLLSPAPITERVLWDGAQTLPTAYNFTEIATHHTHNALHNPPLRAFLDQMHTHGFAIVRGVPTDKDGALEFATMIGPIRRTNWGGLADVKAIANAYDLTMTPRHLEPHSDNPYREPVPGYILLHCLINDAEGGDSTLVDGYRAAQHLREKDAEAFETLTTTVVQFRYRDATALLENKAPLISLDEKENIIQVRYSNRTELIDRLPPEHLNRYYRARQMLWHLIRPQSSLTLRFKLSPGDLLMMDNYRLYHGRSGYTLSTGSRHMRQCYMDRDTVASKRDILHRIHS
ncbi:TauD/TfdA family dioxygenase [Acetobacter conturbans]|nr:TauD/TfdA family dioxygenase [Acetobacter conturbans]